MDASKAFNIIDRDCIMLHLFNHGIKGHLWHLFDSLHTDITSVIKWNGSILMPFTESQAIRQGAISSTGSYKARTDPSLDKLERHSDNLHIGYIPLGAIMVADDLLLASNTKAVIQSLVTAAELDASREQCTFSKTKTKSIIDQRKVCSRTLQMSNYMAPP